MQYDEEGREQAWAIVLPKGYPISAVASEHMALLLCILMAYESQCDRCFMEPAWEDREELNLTVEQREARKHEWNGQITVHADCMAVIHAVRRPGAALRDQFKHGLCYKHAGYGALGRALKVDAHKGRDQATLEGWGEHWKGNDAADQVAKLVRPQTDWQ